MEMRGRVEQLQQTGSMLFPPELERSGTLKWLVDAIQ